MNSISTHLGYRLRMLIGDLDPGEQPKAVLIVAS